MGAADMVPGVSGGTIAMITGIYDQLIRALASLRPGPLTHLARPWDPHHRKQLVDAWYDMELYFLVILGLGMVAAVVVVSGVIAVALDTYAAVTNGFFVGLIAASTVVIGIDITWTPLRLGLGVASAIVTVAVSAVTVALGAPDATLVFIAGAIAVSAMVLPGLSGALLLIILGQYEFLLGELRGFLTGIANISPGAIVDHGTVVAIFIGGAVVGLFTIAHAVDRALSRDRHTTLSILVGLMAGGVYPPGVAATPGLEATGGMVAVGLATVAGVTVIVIFDRVTGDLSYA